MTLHPWSQAEPSALHNLSPVKAVTVEKMQVTIQKKVGETAGFTLPLLGTRISRQTSKGDLGCPVPGPAALSLDRHGEHKLNAEPIGIFNRCLGQTLQMQLLLVLGLW